jgi:hypothetical protein
MRSVRSQAVLVGSYKMRLKEQGGASCDIHLTASILLEALSGANAGDTDMARPRELLNSTRGFAPLVSKPCTRHSSRPNARAKWRNLPRPVWRLGINSRSELSQ